MIESGVQLSYVCTHRATPYSASASKREPFTRFLFNDGLLSVAVIGGSGADQCAAE